MGAFILFDVGGTSTRVGISTDGKKIDKAEITPTPKKFEEGVEAIGRLAGEWAAGAPIERACGGVAGMFNLDRRSLYYSPNLLDGAGKPLAAEIGRAVGAPAIIEN